MKPLLDWPELLAFVVLITGAIVALFARTTSVLYTLCFLAGLVFGRFWFKLRLTNRVQVFLAISGFFMGLALMSLYANLRLMALLLLAGIAAGYELHHQKIIKTV